MALRKTAEEWTSTGVRSTFTIDMPDNPSSSFTSPPTTTCGWGWYFSCTFGPQSTRESPILLDSTSTPIPWRRVTVTFHPNYIASAGYGQVGFDVTIQNLVRLEQESFMQTLNFPVYGGYASQLGVYLRRSDELAPATIKIALNFPQNIGLALPSPRDPHVDRALAGTIRGEEMADVKFYAYARAGEGYVVNPRPLFAKLSLLEGRSEALDDYLSAISGGAGFKESEFVDLDCDSAPEERFASYDYMSDSDLDDEEEQDPDTRGIFLAPTPEAEFDTGPANSVSDTDRPITPPAPPSRSARTGRMGQVIVVKGYAFQTWNAFLYYLYTHQVSFRNLGTKPASAWTSEVPKCSAKSMYKLAEQFGLEELKTLALNSLCSQLSTKNIVREAFSTLTSLFCEVQDIEVEFLVPRIPELKEALEAMVKSVCEGEKPMAKDILCKIIQRRGKV